jgi:hypothetical protein
MAQAFSWEARQAGRFLKRWDPMLSAGLAAAAAARA